MGKVVESVEQRDFQFAAVDWGYSYVKAIVNNERIIFPSAVGNAVNILFDEMNSKEEKEKLDITLDDGMRYFVGQHALNESKQFYHNIGQNRTGRITDVLVKATLGLLFPEDGDCRLVTGLPPSYYDKAKDFIKFLKGQHNFKLNGRQRSIRVTDVLVIPQLLGTYIDYAYDDFGNLKDGVITSGTIALIDPGFGTGDFGLIEGGRYVDGFTKTTRDNMLDVCTTIQNRLENEYDYRVKNILEINEMVKTKTALMHSRQVDISAIVNQARLGTALALVGNAINLWERISPDYYILTGGGAEALYEYMEPELKNLIKPDDSQFANVRGYYKRAVKEWGLQSV